MSPSEKWDEPIPTYEQSVQGGSYNPGVEGQYMVPPSSHSLSHIVANVRSERINTIITSYIDPLLETQALSGLYKTTIALVPSNSSALQTTEKSPGDVIEGSGENIAQKTDEAVIGFPDEDFVKLVRLHGEGYGMEFWRQPAVIRELETVLKARLVATGHKLYDPEAAGAEEPPPPPPPPPPESRPMPPRSKLGLFRKKTKETAAQFQQRMQPEFTLPAPKPLAPGEVRLSVGLEDIALRVLTDMGLYDTKTGKAMVIHMEIGGD